MIHKAIFVKSAFDVAIEHWHVFRGGNLTARSWLKGIVGDGVVLCEHTSEILPQFIGVSLDITAVLSPEPRLSKWIFQWLPAEVLLSALRVCPCKVPLERQSLRCFYQSQGIAEEFILASSVPGLSDRRSSHNSSLFLLIHLMQSRICVSYAPGVPQILISLVRTHTLVPLSLAQRSKSVSGDARLAKTRLKAGMFFRWAAVLRVLVLSSRVGESITQRLR